jgi:hypothetical protein
MDKQKFNQRLDELNKKDLKNFDEEMKKTIEKHGDQEKWEESKKRMLSTLERLTL